MKLTQKAAEKLTGHMLEPDIPSIVGHARSLPDIYNEYRDRQENIFS